MTLCGTNIVHALAVIIIMGFITQFSGSSHAFLVLMNALLHTISHDFLTLTPLTWKIW